MLRNIEALFSGTWALIQPTFITTLGHVIIYSCVNIEVFAHRARYPHSVQYSSQRRGRQTSRDYIFSLPILLLAPILISPHTGLFWSPHTILLVANITLSPLILELLLNGFTFGNSPSPIDEYWPLLLTLTRWAITASPRIDWLAFRRFCNCVL